MGKVKNGAADHSQIPTEVGNLTFRGAWHLLPLLKGKEKRGGGRRTDLYRCRGGNFCLLFPFCYQSGTLQADILLFYGNKISVSCYPRIQPLLRTLLKVAEKFVSEALEESSCQSSLVEANRREEQQDEKYKYLLFYLPKWCTDITSVGHTCALTDS